MFLQLGKMKQKKKRKQRKRITRLTEQQKHEIRRAPFRVRIDDYAESAKGFVTRQRNQRKIAKARSKGYVSFGKMLIPGNSDAYRFIETIAEQKKMTVKQVAKKYSKELKPLLVDNRFPIRREVDNLIDDISVAVGKIYLNDKRISKTDAKYILTKNTNEIKQVTGGFAVIPEVEINFQGNVYIHFPETLPTMKVAGKRPTAEEMQEYEESFDEFLENEDVSVIVSKDEE